MKYLLPLAFLLVAGSIYGQTNGNEAHGPTTWNVKEHQAKGDGFTDDTEAIQATIRLANPGDTVWIPEGTYVVKTLGLRSGVHIKADGLLKQQLDSTEEFTTKRQNSSAPLFRGKNVAGISLAIRAQALHEAIYLSGSQNISIIHSLLSGDSTKVRSFAGVLLYKCKNVTVRQSEVRNFGTDRIYTDHYQPGTGIRILESQNISIIKSSICYNGENGVFIHSSPDVQVLNSTISHNGMSGIQVAFGTSGVEKNYLFENNILHHNAGDAVDINNRAPKGPLDIHAVIKDNDSKENGFVDGKSTPDGSGIATLVNVSNVEVLNNEAKGNNRPAVYAEDCGEIFLQGNVADNQVELVGGLDHLTMLANVFANVTFIKNVHAKYICMENNQLGTLYLPNDITVNTLLLNKNELTNSVININLSGNIQLTGNRILNEGKDPALLLVKADAIRLEDNYLSSGRSPAITIHSSAKNVLIQNNTIQAANTCIIDNGSPGLQIKGNKLTAAESGSHYFTLRSKNPKDLQLTGNEHTGMDDHTVVLMEGKGTAKMDAEKIIKGTTDFGQVKVAKSNL
ncbi:endopolygalacturonase [Echinicola strongylocentroti]|uniref:Endopolygalacturonase n=1 Tax=Echinicola strongylocentroti TaxID=1795355 RepID=A0A2Z4IPI9_9BACT|nr:endopolygalacturonase [Echinicola strongylocentroti]